MRVMKMRNLQTIHWKRLIPSLLLPLAVGGLSALLTKDAMGSFDAMAQPPLSPPAWLFPVVWTLLYLLMGLSLYLVLEAPRTADTATALGFFAAQLAFNFLWSILFFNLGWYLIAFFWLLAMLLLILATLTQFWHIRPAAGALLIPYALWVAFAGYLNLGVYLLNK